jgi:hypothetical protein
MSKENRPRNFVRADETPARFIDSQPRNVSAYARDDTLRSCRRAPGATCAATPAARKLLADGNLDSDLYHRDIGAAATPDHFASSLI